MILIMITVGESCSGVLVGIFSSILLFLTSLMGKDTLMSFGWPPEPRRSIGYRLIWRLLTPSYSLIFWGVPKICSMSRVSSAHSGSGVEVPVLSWEQDLGGECELSTSAQSEKSIGGEVDRLVLFPVLLWEEEKENGLGKRRCWFLILLQGSEGLYSSFIDYLINATLL